ncbi:MAG TPA: PEP-CTERM sorting domain-containing protein [Chthoniobacteraceae bacterium]|nr:PEP-CTERM sorting domain-containing protein [Chthoniobacteraceae bacterium]
MKTPPAPPKPTRRFTPPSAAALLLALWTCCAAEPARAQTSYTYTPSGENPHDWSDSAKWGLETGYPSEKGITINLSKVSVAATLNFDVTPTVGVFNIGPAGVGSGSAAWSIGTASQSFILDNDGDPAVIHNQSGATASITAAILSEGGLRFTGSNTMFVRNGNSLLEGGVTISGGGHIYFYSPGMLSTSVITLESGGTARFGNATATKQVINNDFVVTGVDLVRGIYSNSTTGIELHGDISGTAGVIFGTDSSVRNDTTEVFGENTYEGKTEIRTNVVFHSIENFGQGAIEFASADRKLTYAENNTADITTNYLGAVRSVALNRQTTIDTGANAVTYANAISGSRGLTKEGSGSLTLLGDNTFLNTVLSEGTVVAGHQNAFGGKTGVLAIKTDARLELQAATALDVGELSLESTAQFTFNLTQNPDDTSLTVWGNQTGDSELQITIAPGPGGLAAGDYLLLSFLGDTGAVSFTLAPESAALGSLGWDQETQRLTFHAIPEPNTAFLFVLAVGVAGLAWKKN